MKKLLTISVAAYNVERYITQTLESLCCSNIDKIEVLVVDDGGSDKTLDIVNQYHDRFPESIFPIHKENGGWGSTVNYSIEHASGKYFKLLDGDDYFNVRNLDLLIELLENTEADTIYTPYVRFDDQTGKVFETFNLSSEYESGKPLSIASLDTLPALDMHSVMFRTDILQSKKVRITERCFYTDNEFRTKGLAYSDTILITSLSLYHYRMGRSGQSVDVAGLRKHYEDCISAANAVIEFHKTYDGKLSACVDACVRNGITFVYDSLIILGMKDRLQAFDHSLKAYGEVYYNMVSMMVRLLRKQDFGLLSVASMLLKARYKYAARIKRLIRECKGEK